MRCRIRSAAVCRAWRQHLSQRNLSLWQASLGPSLFDMSRWRERLVLCQPCLHCMHSVLSVAKCMQAASIEDSGDQGHGATDALQLFGLLQRWLWYCGAGLLQLQCRTSFVPGVSCQHACMHARVSAIFACLARLTHCSCVLLLCIQDIACTVRAHLPAEWQFVLSHRV